MLLKDFFEIIKQTRISDKEILTQIRINPNHRLFAGHFPGNPVVPGVVSVQLINDILSDALGMELITSEAKNIKFISMIQPQTHSELSISIKYETTAESTYKVVSEIFADETVFTKFSGILTKKELLK
jgi:3-hydroxyacyl-[acyl-carrier-protein] dehydratase